MPASTDADITVYDPYCEECYETCVAHPLNPTFPPLATLPIETLYVEVTPATFRISTDSTKPTRFEIRNRVKSQQKVFVYCASYIFELKNPKHRNGVWTQNAQYLVPEEVMSFEVGLKDPKDITIEDRDPRMVTAAGFIEIAHYSETAEDVAKRNLRKKQVRDDGPREMYFKPLGFEVHVGCWKEDLIPDQETEFVKSKMEEFPEAFQKVLMDKEQEEFIKERGEFKEMFIKPKEDPGPIELPKPKVEEKKEKKEKKKKRFLGCC